MSKPKITVTISGPSGSGKSLLANHIASSLAILSHADVSLLDDGGRQRLPDSHTPLPLYFNAAVDIHVEKK